MHGSVATLISSKIPVLSLKSKLKIAHISKLHRNAASVSRSRWLGIAARRNGIPNRARQVPLVCRVLPRRIRMPATQAIQRIAALIAADNDQILGQVRIIYFTDFAVLSIVLILNSSINFSDFRVEQSSC